MILLGVRLINKAPLLYRESPNHSNFYLSTIDLYEAWNKPEKPTSGEPYLHKLKILKSDMSPAKTLYFMIRIAPYFLDLPCLQNVSAHINFSLLQADKNGSSG
jgi:hypothetical protein